MRIVIDLQGAQGGSKNRGIGRYSLSLARAMVENKGAHEVIIALNGLFPDSIEPIRSAFDDILPQDNIRVWHAAGPVSQIDPKNTWRSKVAELTREAFLASLQPDIVCVMSLFEGLCDDVLTSIGSFGAAPPTAVILYDLIPLLYRHEYLSNPVAESWYEDKLQQLKKSDLLLAISESSRQEAIDYIGFPQDRVTNIGTSIDAKFQCVDICEEKRRGIAERYSLLRPFVMYTGGDDPRKNIEGLLRAYALLPQALREGHQLVIVRPLQPETRHALETLARRQGLAEHEVVLTGFIPEDDLVALYHLCKVFIFPSWHEGFGLPVLEAMACGAAVIASDTSSLPEVVGREDALFDPHDDRSIAKKLIQVLTDDSFRAQLAQHGLEQARRFSWDKSAKLAIAAFENFHAAAPKLQPALPAQRKKLAYVSPLPPERSGISDYSAELIPSLSRFYDIEVIVAQETVSDPWVKRHCQVRDANWFAKRTHLYDRVLYHFGNSHFHQHMFGLHAQAPGIVVLHDFFMGGISAHMDGSGANQGGWVRELYHAHGYMAVQERFHTDDVWDFAWKYPCNKAILENAVGVIVHSKYAQQLAGQWLGEASAKAFSVIPLLRVPAVAEKKAKARQSLGMDKDAFVVSSFGILGPNKLNHRLLNAWLSSPLGKDKRCVLVFVGEAHDLAYRDKLLTSINESGCADRITITGWTDAAQFRLYLAAADIAVQLRAFSGGETSAAVLDCMNYGLPTIANANGSMAHLPHDAVWMLQDEFADGDLSAALNALWNDDNRRGSLSKRAREEILARHAPDRCAAQYAQAIEHYYALEQSGKNGLIREIAKAADHPAEASEWIALSRSIAQNYPPSSEKQLLIDVSALVHVDLKTGIQRVVRSVLMELLTNPPKGFRVEPVYASWSSQGYRYARQFTLRFLSCPEHVLADEPVDVFPGDVFLGLDLHPEIVPQNADFYQQIRRDGARAYFVIYDLLPILLPHAFPDGTFATFSSWLQTVSQADGVLCISQAVADELAEWFIRFGLKRARPLKVGWFHLGADMAGSVPTAGFPGDANNVIGTLNSRCTFLMVGTIEPRKGHTQALEAFELLWNHGIDVNLVVVGKKGWLMEALLERFHRHPEFGLRLFWLEGISDEYLEKIYESSSCLIAASYGEGYGLPLIEAAQHRLPIIARNIPVFREVAGQHAFYFSGTSPDALANSVEEWLKLNEIGSAPQSVDMPWLTWKQSTQQLLDAILAGRWYGQWVPDGTYRYWGGDGRLCTQVGKRVGRDIVSTNQPGYLLFGPYLALPVGDYRVVVMGTLGKSAGGEAHVDIAVDRGSRILAKSLIGEYIEESCLASLPISLDVSCSDLEIRIWIDGNIDVRVSMVEIRPRLELA